MSWSRAVRTRAGVAGVLAAVVWGASACTSTQAQPVSSTPDLTPVGSAYPLPTSSALPSAATPPLSSATPGGSGISSASSPGSVSAPRSSTTSTSPVASGARATTVPPSGSAASRTPPKTAPPSTRAAATPTRAAATPTLNTRGLSAAEISDRRAIESAWVRYWDTYVSINQVAPAKRLGLLTEVSVDPIRSKILSSAVLYDQKGYSTYGKVAHRPYWGPSVDGKTLAIMGDCLDTSKYGSLVTATKRKRTVGVPRANVRGIFARDADGHWRVSQIQLLPDQAC